MEERKKINLIKSASKKHKVLWQRIFDKWNLFEERNVKDTVHKSIKKTFNSTPAPFTSFSQGGEACIVKFDDEKEVEEVKEVELEEGIFVRSSLDLRR